MIIYSRFNCIHYCNPHEKMDRLRFDENWLRRRLNLFGRFTYPTVKAQTDQDFEWIGIVHPDTPEWFFDVLKSYDRMKVVKAEVDTDIAIRGAPSINLDTDDAIADSFVARAKQFTTQGEYIFRRGMKYHVVKDLAEPSGSRSNHFNIVNHPHVTVLDFSHCSEMNTRIVETKNPMWLQVIHQDNVSNRLKPASKSKPHGVEKVMEYFSIDIARVGDGTTF